MYEARISETICIAHRVPGPAGQLGPLHGHNWTVEVELTSESLDPLGRIADLDALRAALHDVVDPVDHRTLDDLPAFAAPTSRTAPAFARWVAERVAARVPDRVAIVRVGVSDGTGAVVSFRPRGSE